MKHLVMKYWLCLLFLSLTLTACQEDAQVLEKDDASAASLTLTFAVSGEEPGSRGLEDLNDDGTITEAEKNMDGSRMFSLAVFIVDSQNEIVAKKTTLTDGEVSFSQNNTQATVAFTNLNYGETYQLLAIANFGEGAHYQIANNVDATTLLNGTVSTSSSGYICPNGTPYPLTLKKEIVLQPGANTISGELVRTFARIRITVRNQSSTNDLQIKSLSFPEQFTYHTANLFETGGNGLSQPVVSHTGAVDAFTGTPAAPLVIGKNGGEVKSATIFDAYLLESNGGDYTYTLTLGYDDTYSLGNSLTTVSAIAQNKQSYFLIQNVRSQNYMKAENGVLVQAPLGEIKDFLWKLVEYGNGNNTYHIVNVATGYYIGQPNSGNVPVSEDNDGFYYKFENYSNYVQMGFQGTGLNGTYLNDWEAKKAKIGGWNRNDSGNRFRFHVVNLKEHEETIPLATINPSTQESSPITAINRNDLINILVNVSYSEKLGEFKFEVTNWDTGGGDVTFD